MLTYFLAALAEIGGCYCFWACLRLGKPIWWTIPGLISLACFAWLLTLTDSSAAGRTYAAYGGVYILSSLSWLWLVEGVQPDRWDLAGTAFALAGTSLILFGPRGAK